MPTSRHGNYIDRATLRGVSKFDRPFKPIDPPADYHAELFVPGRKPDILPQKVTDFVVSSSHFADAHFSLHKKPTFVKPKRTCSHCKDCFTTKTTTDFQNPPTSVARLKKY